MLIRIIPLKGKMRKCDTTKADFYLFTKKNNVELSTNHIESCSEVRISEIKHLNSTLHNEVVYSLLKFELLLNDKVLQEVSYWIHDNIENILRKESALSKCAKILTKRINFFKKVIA